MPTPEARKSRLRAKIINGILVGFLFIYIAISVLVMRGLVEQNTEFCAQRQTARSTIRHLFETKSPDWTLEDQKFLDEGLAKIVPC